MRTLGPVAVERCCDSTRRMETDKAAGWGVERWECVPCSDVFEPRPSEPKLAGCAGVAREVQ